MQEVLSAALPGEQGAATRRFLESTGWAPDGATRALDVDDQLIPQLRLHTALVMPPPTVPGPAVIQSPTSYSDRRSSFFFATSGISL